ncbi:hypothetical protein CEQ90_14825 [Lewinellaceae bacterium SD302]|nr:hypothetical protein CEQ90_14825 [Lewinellaceae bacterium SD302]
MSTYSGQARRLFAVPLFRLSLAAICILPLSLFAQEHPHGKVLDDAGYPLIGATVRWVDGEGSVTDIDGVFKLETARPEAGVIAFSYIGFATLLVKTDTVEFPLSVTLIEDSQNLDAVEVTARDKGSFVSTLADRNVESLTSTELRKAPCCSLGESFENSPTVDLSYGDPLTGRREIRVLGLKGNYTLLTMEKRPMFTGLATPYAFDMIPGTWVNGIQIGKGSGSVASSAAGLNGQINTELQKPMDDSPLFINLFAGTQGRLEANVHLNRQLSESLYGGLYLHGSLLENDHDHDFDRFKDMPDRRTRSALFRLFRANPNDKWVGQWNLYVSRDQREGGQQDVHDHGQSTLAPYLINQLNDHVEFFGKTGYFGFAKPHQSIGFIYSGSYHKLNNLYGREQHLGEQRSAYLNAMYQTRIVNDDHQLELGLTGQFDNIQEQLSDRSYDRNERTIGASGEYTYSWEQFDPEEPFRAFTAIASMRVDHHNIAGVQASPRASLKYNPSEKTALRVSAGRGWRSPNVLVENLNYLPTSRTIRLPDATIDAANPGFVGIESAWTYGLNLTQNFTLGAREGSIVVDFFRTDFQDQIVLDVEQDKDNLFFYQLDGRSFSKGAMLSLSYEILPKIDLRAAYKYTEVKTEYATNGLRQTPLTPKHRALASLDYDGNRFRFNLNYQWTGTQRLPDHDFISESIVFPHPQTAPEFGLVNTQLTYVANAKSEFYAGVENLTNVTQRNPIIGDWEPFDGDYFDASQVYQPLFERRFFLGWRFSL